MLGRESRQTGSRNGYSEGKRGKLLVYLKEVVGRRELEA